MKDFFASLYEWFGLNPFFSRDMGDWLRGWDSTCTDYLDTSNYVVVGCIMLLLTGLFYALQYHILDSSRWNKKRHWWFFAMLLSIFNFISAFIPPFNAIQGGNFCNQLNLSISDCIGFGFSNAIWSFLLFLFITTIPLVRKFSVNCRHTTFWKP